MLGATGGYKGVCLLNRDVTVSKSAGNINMNTSQHQPPFFTAARYAGAALLAAHFSVLLAALVALALPGVVFCLLRMDTPQYLVQALVIERAVELLVLALLAVRVCHAGRQAAARIFAVGALLSAPYLAAQVGMVRSDNFTLGAAFTALLIAAIALLYRYYFYFAPLADGERSWRRLTVESGSILELDRGAPLKIELVHFAYASAISAVFGLIDVSGQHQLIKCAGILLLHAGWLIAVLLAFGFCCGTSAAQYWRGGPPIVPADSRYAGSWFARAVRPLPAAMVLLAATLLHIANGMRLSVTPPAAQIEVLEFSRHGPDALLRIQLSDPVYQLFGFAPHLLNLRPANGAGRYLPSTAVIEESGQSALYAIRPGADRVTAVITFSDAALGDEQQDSFSLWYRSYKVASDLKPAATPEPPMPEELPRQ